MSCSEQVSACSLLAPITSPQPVLRTSPSLFSEQVPTCSRTGPSLFTSKEATQETTEEHKYEPVVPADPHLARELEKLDMQAASCRIPDDDPAILNPSRGAWQSRHRDSEAWQSRRRETGTTPAVEKSPAGMCP